MATGVSPSAVDRCGDEGDEDRSQEQLPNRPPRATRQPHRGGYDCEFVKPPPVDFHQTDCPVCLLVLREPHQTSCCSNSYCEACVKRVQHDEKCCPTCNEADFTIFPDKRLKRSLYALKVYCCQRGEGCEWEGELGDLDGHLNLTPPPEKLLVGCQFAEVDCTHCVQPFQRRYVEAHQSDDCIKRPFTCQYCKKYDATFEEVTQNHSLVCPFFPLSCPNNCELQLQRQGVEHHVSQDCPLTLVQCDFHVVGCHTQLARRDMAAHVSENITKHMSLVHVHIMAHSGENMATYMLLIVGSLQQVVQDNANIRHDLQEGRETLQETCDKLQQSRVQLQQTHDALRESQDKVHQLQRAVVKLITIKDDLTHKRAVNEQKIQTLEATLNQHPKEPEVVTCTGTLPFDFTMTEFERHKTASDEWHSPPFYMHTHGYKMCIKVYANGFGSGKGTHVSVYAYLMRGDFDDNLRWPFQYAITVQLLNQLEDTNHYTHIFDFTKSRNLKSIGRVTFTDIAGSGWGSRTFKSHSILGCDTDKGCQYLKDDQLKFRVLSAAYLKLPK